MRKIFIDLSSDNYLQQPKMFGGYEGEHNETYLQVKLPQRMIDIECSGYRFDFQTPDGNKISSPLIQLSEDETLSFHLIQQLTVAGKLIFKAVAVLAGENTVDLISKTNTVILCIENSPKGNVQLLDPNGYKDELLKMIDARILEINPSEVDQTYIPESDNAQSGKAVAEAVAGKQDKLIAGDNIIIDKNNIISVASTNTVLGNSIRVNDVSPSEHNLKVKLTSDTITDFSGVNVSRYGKNLIPYPYASTTITDDGVTFTDNGDGTITANGTATNHAYFLVSDKDFLLPKGDFFLSGCPTGGSGSTYNMYVIGYDNGKEVLRKFDFGNGIAFTSPVDNLTISVNIWIQPNTTVNNLVFKPQIELGTSKTEYEEYKASQALSANTDGTVEGLTSISPNMTLLTDTDNTIINLTYYKVATDDDSDSNILVDQTYNPKSENAQSGKAVAQAVETKLSAKSNVIEYYKQVVLQGSDTYLRKEIVIEKPEIRTPYTIKVKSIENSPYKTILMVFRDVNGKEMESRQVSGTENLVLSGTPGDGVAQIMFTLYATASGGLEETPALFNEVYIIKGYDIEYEIPKINVSQNPQFLPKSSTIKTICHRGKANTYVTPLSRTAYIETRKKGFTAAESDLQFTADGVFVMCHSLNLGEYGHYDYTTGTYWTLEDITGKKLYVDSDNNWYWYDTALRKVYTYDYTNQEYVESNTDISELTIVDGSTIKVADVNYEQIKRINTGHAQNNYEQILTFEEWIVLMKKLGMEAYIDVKVSLTEEQWANVVNIVRSKGMLKHVTWILNYNDITLLRAQDPSARFGLVSNISISSIEALASYTDNGEVIYFGHSSGITQEIADKVRESGLILECWAIPYNGQLDTEEEIVAEVDRLMELGIEGIELDYNRVEEIYING